MKSIKKNMETYLSEEVKRLSEKYGFVHEEAMEYLRSDGVESCVLDEKKKEKRGRPEKKSKKVVSKGEMVDDKIIEIMKTME